MPMCTYGAACTRKGCAYRHPTKHVVNEDVVCMPFLTDNCLFGSKCRNKHVSADEKQRLLAKFATKPCRFGEHCRTQGCLYKHPGDAKLSISSHGVADDDLAARIANQERQKQAYEAALLAHQQQMKALQAQQQGHSQEDQQQQYPPLGYAQNQVSGASSGVTNNVGASFPSLSTSQVSQQQDQDETTGQTYGWWSQQGYDTSYESSYEANYNASYVANYNDEGYEETNGTPYQDMEGQPGNQTPWSDSASSMYPPGPSRDSNTTLSWSSMQNSQERLTATPSPWVAGDMPTPAEASNLLPSSGNASVNEVAMTMAQRLKLNASSASQTQQQQQQQQQQTDNGVKRLAAVRTIRIPQELWVDAAFRNSGAFDIPDPLQRFVEANSVHKHQGVIDLHFQSAYTFEVVLDHMLLASPLYDKDKDDPQSGYIWVITGSGHHTTQRLYKLFDLVREYLDNHGYTYMIGKDNKGYQGAFYVRIKRV